MPEIVQWRNKNCKHLLLRRGVERNWRTWYCRISSSIHYQQWKSH